MLEQIFGENQFQNEIVWKRTHAHGNIGRRYGVVSDSIFFYNGVTYMPHPNGWSCDLERMKQYDREGRLHFPTKASGQLRLKMYLDESSGPKLQNIWDDIPPINSQAAEALVYPTQKPLPLLERI